MISLNDLTEDQREVFNLLQGRRRAAVAGCVGSGKTLLALENAIRLDGEGKRVLILCHNPYLAEDLRKRLAGTGVQVYSFAAFVLDLLGKPEKLVSRTWSRFDEPTELEVIRASDRMLHEGLPFDAVIVDEGQDFRDGWWELVEACLRDPEESLLHIFYENNPVALPVGFGLSFPVEGEPIILNTNCRNAGEIHRLVERLHTGAPEIGAQRKEQGVVREWVYGTENEAYDRLKDALIAAEEMFPRLENVVVITGENVAASQSKLDGWVIDTPGVSRARTRGQFDWQNGVLRYLRGLGLSEFTLSNALSPSEEDRKNVARFSRGLIRRPKITSLHWDMDKVGNLLLYSERGESPVIPREDILSFFSSPEWANTLPSPHKRYRLTVGEDFSKYPQFYNVRLVDIPSFKGLEAGGVIFVSFGPFTIDEPQLKSNLYFAFSRAREVLHIVNPSNVD